MTEPLSRIERIRKLVEDEAQWSALMRANLDPVSHEDIVLLLAEIDRLRAALEQTDD